MGLRIGIGDWGLVIGDRNLDRIGTGDWDLDGGIGNGIRDWD